MYIKNEPLVRLKGMGNFMKKSKYNLFFSVDENRYVFNAMTSSLAKVDSSFGIAKNE